MSLLLTEHLCLKVSGELLPAMLMKDQARVTVGNCWEGLRSQRTESSDRTAFSWGLSVRNATGTFGPVTWCREEVPRNDPKTTPKRPRNDPETTPNRPPTPKRPRNDPETTPKRPQNDPKTTPNPENTDAKTTAKRPRNDPLSTSPLPGSCNGNFRGCRA